MKNNPLTLSIVIPVYNEEDYLKACLDSIAEQTLSPDEVIVVDNNSTDESVKIAKSYSFVRVLHETRQHQVFAQATGFAAASNDVLGRIDADTILPKNWVRNVKTAFIDPQVVAVTGGTTPYDVKLKKIAGRLFSFYINLASKLGGAVMVWGANCAIRRSSWDEVKMNLLMRDDIWEDQDLSFNLAKCGRIIRLSNIDVGSSFRAIHGSPLTQFRYHFRAIRTFYLHKGLLRTGLFAIVWYSLLPISLVAAFDLYILQPIANLKKSNRLSN